MGATRATVSRVTTSAGDPAWRIRGHDAVRRLLSDPRLGRTHPHPERAARYSDSVIFGRPMPSSPTEHEDHARMRRLLGRSFSTRRLAVLRPRVQELVDGLLEQLARKTPPVDFHEMVSFPLPALVICELLGVPFEDRDDFRRWSDDAADMADEARSLGGLAALWQYMNELVERKRRDPAADVLSDLVAAHAREPEAFSSEEVAKLGAGLLFAGHETTVAAIDKGVLLLLTHPAQREALERDPDLIPSTVEEVLRHPLPVRGSDNGAATGLPRWANEDIDIDEVSIRAGELVLLDLQDANLDDRLFPAPDAFDVARTGNSHLTFGHGPYFCIGAPLARMELQTLFGSLFRRFPTLALAAPRDALRPRSRLLTGGLTELPVTW